MKPLPLTVAAFVASIFAGVALSLLSLSVLWVVAVGLGYLIAVAGVAVSLFRPTTTGKKQDADTPVPAA